MLQNDPQVAQIRKALTGRVLTELETLAEKDAPAFEKIWDAFGSLIKEGIYEDFERRDQLLALTRFTTTSGSARSLKQYVTDLRPNQTEIYYLVGDSLERVKSNPKLEAARARGIEVLLLTDPVDAFWTAGAPGFEGKPLKSLSQGEINLDLVPRLEAATDAEPASDTDAAVIEVVKNALGEAVSEVRASQRLTDSAACLVASGHGPDRQLERLLTRAGRGAGAKPILELKMRHALVKALGLAQTQARADDVADLAALLLDQAQILDGELPNDPGAFAARLNRLVVRGL
jgi:molecular chaperone HtpG